MNLDVVGVPAVEQIEQDLIDLLHRASGLSTLEPASVERVRLAILFPGQEPVGARKRMRISLTHLMKASSRLSDAALRYSRIEI